MTKVTKREKFQNIINIMQTGESAYPAEDVVAFCEAEIAALDKKAAKAKERAVAKAAEADELKDAIAAVLTEEFQTIPEITATVVETYPDASVNKVTNRLTKLIEDGVAVKEQITIPKTETAKARKCMAYKLAD